MTTIKEWQKKVYALAKEKGWHSPDKSFGECIVMAHAELSEAIEEYRNQHTMRVYYLTTQDGIGKPEGVAIELADTVIRILDTCEQFGIDLERAMEIKHEYNKTRSFRHGNKKI